jgi:hypothetical protein
LLGAAGLGCLAACGPEAAPLASADRAVTSETVFVPTRDLWWVSPTAGDRGTSWRVPGYDPSTQPGWTNARGPLGYGESYVNVIPYGSDPNNKPVTVYFLRTFTVSDPTKVASLRLDANYDDGFVVYINGQEAARASMPAGPVSYATLSPGHEANNRYETFDLSTATATLRAGTNTLAVEVHQASPSSSDLVFDVALSGQVESAPPPPPPPSAGGIARGSSWAYWDRGGDLGSAWRQPGYNDSAWVGGAGPLGYGESYLHTNISYGPDASNKYITTYFRKQFTVDNPDDVLSLVGEVMYDDGFVVYLNGQLVGKAFLPSGAITASTLASSHEAQNAYSTFNWTPHKVNLVQGVNTIAVELHQDAPSSSDLVFDLALKIETRPPPLPGGVARRSAWKYFDRGGDLGTAWRGLTYDDSAWASGGGPLGYGETYVATTLSYGPDPAQKPITTYFRRKFTLEDLSTIHIDNLHAELMYDDGLVVYLNGQEIHRSSMPAGTIGASTLAASHEANNVYEVFDWTAAKPYLRSGENMLAVEVHQQAPSSSDLVFDLGLEVVSIPIFTRYPGNPIVHSPAPPAWNYQRSDPSVLRLGASSWVMFYTANDGDGPHYQIGRAVSNDGLAWSFDPQPLLIGLHATVTYDGSTYRMWREKPLDGGIWLATSPDGRTWTEVGSGPVLENLGTWENQVADPTVVFDGTHFQMWYEGRAITSGLWLIGHATSSDGISWTRYPSQQSDDVTDPSVMWAGDHFEMWFASATGLRTIIYARSWDGIDWARFTFQPSLAASQSGSWDALPSPGTVLRDGGTLRMWYSGQADVSSSPPQIGYATHP